MLDKLAKRLGIKTPSEVIDDDFDPEECVDLTTLQDKQRIVRDPKTGHKYRLVGGKWEMIE